MKRLLFLTLIASLAMCNNKMINIETNGGAAVNIQDQSTRSFSLKLNTIVTTNIKISTVATLNQYDIRVISTKAVATGNNIAFLEQNGAPELHFGKILAKNATKITMDTPVPYQFTSAAVAFVYDENMAVDGSTDAKTFGITNFFNQSVDITKVLIHITDGTAMDDALFGGITALTRGCVLRIKHVDGTYTNLWNVKSNGQISELTYNKSYDAKAPSGVYGFSSEINYSGQMNHGVVLRLKQMESIEMVVQDNLTGLSSFNVMIEGHFTQD